MLFDFFFKPFLFKVSVIMLSQLHELRLGESIQKLLRGRVKKKIKLILTQR